MNTIKTLLVDDEFLALNLLEQFIGNIPDLSIVAKVKSPMKALEILNNERVDLLFLDIQMPTLSGNNLLKTLKSPPVTIFTTAYSDYAVEAFELNAVDYLLKPFSFERFVQAVNKAREYIQKGAQPTPLTKENEKPGKRPFYTTRIDGKLVRIFFDDIIYVEGLKEYVRFICHSGKYIALESLKNLEELLPPEEFMRVHKSFIVALDKVTCCEGNRLELEGFKIPVSRAKKDEVIKRIFNSGDSSI